MTLTFAELQGAPGLTKKTANDRVVLSRKTTIAHLRFSSTVFVYYKPLKGVHHSNTQTRTREVPNSHGHGYHFLSHFLFSPLHHLRHILLLANNPARNEFPSRWPH